MFKNGLRLALTLCRGPSWQRLMLTLCVYSGRGNCSGAKAPKGTGKTPIASVSLIQLKVINEVTVRNPPSEETKDPSQCGSRNPWNSVKTPTTKATRSINPR